MNSKYANVQKKDSTHKLSCKQGLCRGRIDYWMACIVLKEMPNNRLKILVFGERYWKREENKKQIRYVDKFRVKPNSDF